MLENVTRNMVLAKKPMVADGFFTRGFGMIFRTFNAFDAMIFPRCRSIHTYFMRQDLDLIFINKEKEVLRFESNVKPWRMISGPVNTSTVIELPPGLLCGIPLSQHDTLAW